MPILTSVSDAITKLQADLKADPDNALTLYEKMREDAIALRNSLAVTANRTAEQEKDYKWLHYVIGGVCMKLQRYAGAEKTPIVSPKTKYY